MYIKVAKLIFISETEVRSLIRVRRSEGIVQAVFLFFTFFVLSYTSTTKVTQVLQKLHKARWVRFMAANHRSARVRPGFNLFSRGQTFFLFVIEA